MKSKSKKGKDSDSDMSSDDDDLDDEELSLGSMEEEFGDELEEEGGEFMDPEDDGGDEGASKIKISITIEMHLLTSKIYFRFQ